MNVFPWQTLIRTILKVGAGILGREAWFDDSVVEGLSAVGAALIGVAWGVIEKVTLHRRLKAALEAADSAPSI